MLSVVSLVYIMYLSVVTHASRASVSIVFLFFKQKTAYEMRISDWSSDVCSSDLRRVDALGKRDPAAERRSEQDGERQGEAVDQAGQRQEYPRQVGKSGACGGEAHGLSFTGGALSVK